jgi:galactokinase
MINLERLRARFELHYGETPRVFSAPGRVNLIGEHTDYNDGFVLPMAIERRTYVAGTRRNDRRVLVHFSNQASSLAFDLDRPGPKCRGSWLDYVEGTAQALLDRGMVVGGANLLLESDVPAGVGLAASAALELAVAYALVKLGGAKNSDRVELALAGQAAEHAYVGTQCGIMDQYIAALGVEGHALLIDCRSLRPIPMPLKLGSSCVLICDTTMTRELSWTPYNERRGQCEHGVELLARELPGIRALRDVSVHTFDEQSARIPELIRRRCRHVVTENLRTVAAAIAFEGGHLAEAGALMYASHRSLRDDYEVSCPELDLAVEGAASVSGVYGSRMTGGGFGGCTVTILERASVEPVIEAILRRFAVRFPAVPTFFVTEAGAGAREE